MHRIGTTAGRILALAACGLAIWVLSGSLPEAGAVAAEDITVAQAGDQLVINVNNPGNAFLIWQFSYVTVGSSCDDNATFLAIAPEDSNDGQATIRLSPADSQLNLCLRVSDQETGEETFKVFRLQPLADDQPPAISVSRPGNNVLSVTSHDADLDVASWTYGRFDSDPNCRTAALNTRLPEQRTNSITLEEADNGRWFCFGASDLGGNRARVEYRVSDVDTSGPELVAVQDGRVLRAESEDDENLSGWSYVASPSEIDCDGDTFLNNRSALGGRQITLTADRINYHYCFRARDETGNWGYVKYQVESVDFLAAKIRLRQDGLRIVAESDRAVEFWHYVRADAAIGCGLETNFEEATDFSDDQIIELGPEDHRHFFCVRGVNRTNTASFAILEAVISAIEIKLEIDGEEALIASAAGENLSWYYFKSEDEPDCDEGDRQAFESASFESYRGSTSRLSRLDNGLWFCFRAVDDYGNAGYAKRLISGITTAPPGEDETGNRGQTDVAIIAIASVIAGAGIVVFIFLNKRQQSMPAIEPFASRRRKKRKAGPKKKAGKEEPAGEEMIQPLDYLKGDDEK